MDFLQKESRTQLNVQSNIVSPPEGLQEYWIQWKNKDAQFDCK